MRTVTRMTILAATVVLLLIDGCKENPVEPKNAREYSWSMKEISHPNFQVLATDVWGSSSNNVYVTCLSGGTRGHKLFHYDGSGWSEVDIGQFGSSQVVFNLYAISGFSATDVWAVGERLHLNSTPPPNFLDSSLIIRFNGSTWIEAIINPKQKMLKTIGASSPTDVWFGGREGTLYHFDGVKVHPDSLGVLIADKKGHNLIVGAFAGNTSDNMYAFYNDFTTGYFHFLKRSGNRWTELDSQFVTQTSLWVSPSGKLFSTFFGYGLYVWNGQAPWTPFYIEGNASVRVFGTSENNVFVSGQHGGLYHHNGIDWHQFKNLESTTINFSAVWTDGKEVFVIGNDGFKSYIYHGK